ncbi:MAG: hypothetical protein MUO62_12840 [Anaerolineales bacterium]|nr:hypothetical protein [Anaerolineales bacterium]
MVTYRRQMVAAFTCGLVHFSLQTNPAQPTVPGSFMAKSAQYLSLGLIFAHWNFRQFLNALKKGFNAEKSHKGNVGIAGFGNSQYRFR